MHMQYACLQCVHLESICKRVYVQCEGCGVTCSSHAMKCELVHVQL